MFFVLSKVLGFITVPSNAIFLIGALGVVLLLTGRGRAGKRTLVLAILLLLVFGYSPAGNVLMLTLSERFPAWRFDGRAPDGIIVLGGAIDSESSDARNTIEISGSAGRVFAMLELARKFPDAKIVYTGGSANLLKNSVPEAPLAGKLLREFGVGADRIVLEGESRTTEENAVYTRRM